VLLLIHSWAGAHPEAHRPNICDLATDQKSQPSAYFIRRSEGWPSPGAGVSALHGNRQGFQDPLRGPATTRLGHQGRNDQCPGCGRGVLDPAPGRTCNGNAHACTPVICSVCDGTRLCELSVELGQEVGLAQAPDLRTMESRWVRAKREAA
jgi:hypothetical protein